MSTQNQNSQKPEETRRQNLDETTQKQQQPEELNEADQKDVKGGSGLLSGGNDLTNIIQGGIGITNSSSGSDGDDSYTSNDSHRIDLGLGNMLDNTNF